MTEKSVIAKHDPFNSRDLRPLPAKNGLSSMGSAMKRRELISPKRRSARIVSRRWTIFGYESQKRLSGEPRGKSDI
jgi:hypothetical protein